MSLWPLLFHQKDIYLLQKAIIFNNIALDDFWLDIPKYLEIFPREYPKVTNLDKFVITQRISQTREMPRVLYSLGYYFLGV